MIKTAMYLGIFFASIVLISTGITGYSVISQSCCLGDDCPDNYKCSSEDNNNVDFAAVGLGLFLMLISLAEMRQHLQVKGHID